MKTSSLIITALGVAVSANALAEDTNWVDKQHQNVQNKLHHWSNGINDWLGETDPNKPAKASLRVMVDSEWDKHNGFSVKPRVRGKIKLPVLKKRLSVVFGDEDIENREGDKGRVGGNYRNLEREKYYNSKEARNDSCSRSRILGNVTAKSGNSEKSVISHFKRILTANFEKIKRPLN